MKNIYIVLSQTGTIVSKAIRFHTKDPYNHVSISFDRELEVMYSFGRRKRYNIFNAGLINENFGKGVFCRFPNANCCVLEIPVTDEEYKGMYDIVNYFYRNRENYSYNFIGVLGYILGIRVKRKDHFFCSQFVSYILGEADFWHFIPEFTKPMDFFQIPHKRLIYEGNITGFKMQSMQI